MQEKQVFVRVMRVLVVMFFVSFVYLIAADRRAPFTTEGRVYAQVVQIAPEVTGRVSKVLVENNEQVEKGDVLFELDPNKFIIALEQAELSLNAAKEQQSALYSQKQMAKANIARAEAVFNSATAEYERVVSLANNQVVSKSVLDSALEQYQVASSLVEIEKHHLDMLLARLGESSSPTTDVLLAKNRVEQAKLDLHNSKVRAPSDGVVSNLRLEAGAMASANMPLVTLIADGTMWVGADFREKSVANITEDYRALVTFDAYPGKIFDYSVQSRDFGVASGHQNPNGTLTQIDVNNRWVRDAQRTRINVASDSELPSSLFVGSRATLSLYSNDNYFWKLIARARIRLISWFHFIY